MDPADVLSAGDVDQAFEVVLARVPAVVGQAVSDDLREIDDTGPVPVVAGLVRHQDDGLGAGLAGLAQGSEGVLEHTHREELGSFGGVAPDTIVRVQEDADDLLVLLGGGAQVPLRHDLTVVAHRAGVVDHERDRRLGVLDDLVDHLGSARHGDYDAVSRLERVRPGVLVPVVAVALAVAAHAVAVLELRTTRLVERLQLGLVLELEVQERHVVVVLSDRPEAVAVLDHVGLRLADGLLDHHDGGVSVPRCAEGCCGVVTAADCEAERES